MLLIRTMLDQNLIVGLVVLAVVALFVYAYAPKLKGLLSGVGLEGFASGEAKGKLVPKANVTAGGSMGGNGMPESGLAALNAVHAKKVPAPASAQQAGSEGFADFATVGTVPMAAAQKPQGCYPREQLNPMELLPSDPN